MANIKPIGNKILVKKNSNEKSQSGILLPDSSKSKTVQGTVIACGEGKVNDKGVLIKPTVNVGDTIIFSTYAGTEVSHEGESFLIVSEDEILGIFG